MTKKQATERWADYAARRVQETRVDLTPYVSVDGLESGICNRVYTDENWKLHIGFTLDPCMSTEIKRLSGLIFSLDLEDILREEVTISNNEGSILFRFERDTIVLEDAENIIGMLGPLDKYGGPVKESYVNDIPINARIYPAQQFVEDLVLFAQKELKGKTNLAYKKINARLEYHEYDKEK